MRKCKGFSLVELLVVLAIIGVLVGLLVPAIQAARNAAKNMEQKKITGVTVQAAVPYASNTQDPRVVVTSYTTYGKTYLIFKNLDSNDIEVVEQVPE